MRNALDRHGVEDVAMVIETTHVDRRVGPLRELRRESLRPLHLLESLTVAAPGSREFDQHGPIGAGLLAESAELGGQLGVGAQRC